jgi:hypothetical protein
MQHLRRWIWHWRCCRRHFCMPGDHMLTCDLYNIYQVPTYAVTVPRAITTKQFCKMHLLLCYVYPRYKLQNHYTDFLHVSYMGILLNFVCTVQLWLKWDNGNNVHEDLHAFLHISNVTSSIYIYIYIYIATKNVSKKSLQRNMKQVSKYVRIVMLCIDFILKFWRNRICSSDFYIWVFPKQTVVLLR